MPNPRSRRKPGRLVRLKQSLPARLTAQASLQEIRDFVLKLQTYLGWMSDNQDDLNRYEWFRYDSLPGKHGPTHLGGDDNIIGSATPTPITIGAIGDRGDPHSGASASDHTHGFILGPGEIDPDVIDGSPNPPFLTLTQQLDWHNARAARVRKMRAVKPILANTWI